MIKDKFISQENDFDTITNDELECANCIWKTKQTLNCAKYRNEKPFSVIKGNSCPKKEVKLSDG